ncbi:NUDIX hydrolase [Dyadobacter psychrotolerans]|uniref:GDP-mannose pyrophosphatase n=1 Tax=Dyadobacter psychrotolerans TaxID=2541721 RepID=A0A4R5DKE8_9BACT|nr:NUDIX domain-containing protein [Dyadobacter psychrotolerans]TDE14642.1 NUDIX domain-containing protein [Dyadobacter psychrotolerans]
MTEQLIDSHKYNLWKDRLESNGLEIHRIDELYSRRNHQGEVLFSLLYTDATTPEGNKIPPICFLKGEVVCVLICFIDSVTKEKYLLLVRQRRICDGSLTYEHPAGMLDSESDAASVAAREVWEETGIKIEIEQLVKLNDEPFFPSTGTSDEAMYLFYCELELTHDQIISYHNKSQGLLSDHEYIDTFVVPFAEGHKLITNVNGILLNFMYLKNVGDWELLKQL